jgi:hypothetical protein
MLVEPAVPLIVKSVMIVRLLLSYAALSPTVLRISSIHIYFLQASTLRTHLKLRENSSYASEEVGSWSQQARFQLGRRASNGSKEQTDGMASEQRICRTGERALRGAERAGQRRGVGAGLLVEAVDAVANLIGLLLRVLLAHVWQKNK